MVDDIQDDELILQATARHSVAPDVIKQLLSLAPKFENITIHGMKAELGRAVEGILDKAESAKGEEAQG